MEHLRHDSHVSIGRTVYICPGIDNSIDFKFVATRRTVETDSEICGRVLIATMAEGVGVGVMKARVSVKIVIDAVYRYAVVRL